MSSWFPYNQINNSQQQITKGRLFCFPHSGGVASIFRKWQSYMPTTLEVYPVQLPGRETRFAEQPLHSLQSVLEALWPHILCLLDRPVALFGHSLGALIAFELAKQIETRCPHQKIFVFVSACSAPQYLDHRFPLHNLSDDEFILQLKSYGAMPKQLLENREALELFLPRLKADFKIFETYSSPNTHIHSPLVAFGAEQDELIDKQHWAGWQWCTSGFFDQCVFSGGHFYYQQSGEQLCKQIDRYLADRH